MKKNIIDLLDEAVKNIPGELHREGKNLIGYEPLLSKEHCYIIYPDKRACLIDYDYEQKKVSSFESLLKRNIKYFVLRIYEEMNRL